MLNNKLNFLTTVLRLRQVVGGVVILKALHTLSETEWERSSNLDTGDHLIKGVFTSATKTDAVRAYVSKLAKLYMNSIGVLPGSWTKNTLTAENTLTKFVIDRVAVTEIGSNEELFRLVVGRILGADDELVEAAMVAEDDYTKKFKHIVNYLGWSEDEVDSPEILYRDVIIKLTELAKRGQLNDEFFDKLLDYGLAFFNAEVEIEMDALDVLDSVIDSVLQAEVEYHDANNAAIDAERAAQKALAE